MMVLYRIVCLLAVCAPVTVLSQTASLPTVQVFAPGVVSGPANDGSPTFSPDGKTLFFTRYAAHWSVILESHLVNNKWSEPVLAPFSGQWTDSSPTWSPDGKYIVFVSTRPKTPLKELPKPGEPIPGIASNLWRVNWTQTGWSEPARLPDEVNITDAIFKPSVAANGDVFLTVIGPGTAKSIYVSLLRQLIANYKIFETPEKPDSHLDERCPRELLDVSGDSFGTIETTMYSRSLSSISSTRSSILSFCNRN